MKKHFGFVTNSSSTCYIVYIPNNIKQILEDNKESIEILLKNIDFDKVYYELIEFISEDGASCFYCGEEDDGFYDILKVIRKFNLILYDINQRVGGYDSIININSPKLHERILLDEIDPRFLLKR